MMHAAAPQEAREMLRRNVRRIALALVAALFALSLTLSACGGDGGGDKRPTPANDEEAILHVFQDYAEFRDDGEADKLAGLFSSVTCTNRESQARGIIANWDLVKDAFSIRVDSVTVQTIETDHAVVLPVGALIEGETTHDLSSQPVEMQREDGAWKIASCGLVLPNVPFELPLQ